MSDTVLVKSVWEKIVAQLETVCRIVHVLYIVAAIHVTLLTLSLLVALVGTITPSGEVVLVLATVINVVFLSIAVGILLFCRRRSQYTPVDA